MHRMRAARAALVALSALGMIWTTPALAATYDVSPSSTYAKVDPNTPPTHPNIPVPGPTLQAGPADLDVNYLSVSGGNGSYQWTYEVKNLGGGTAYNTKVMTNYLRNNYMGDIQSNIEYVTLGSIGPGASKTVVVSCAPKWGEPPCASSSAKASTTTADSNPGNDWDTSPNILP
jgi:hypothetical protein